MPELLLSLTTYSYRSRISGPLLDRIDQLVEVSAVPQLELVKATRGENSESVRVRVESAFQRQIARQGKPNAKLEVKEIDAICVPDEAGESLLKSAIARMGLSARAYHRVLKVARTIADLAGAERLASEHIAEAIQYRKLDRAS